MKTVQEIITLSENIAHTVTTDEEHFKYVYDKVFILLTNELYDVKDVDEKYTEYMNKYHVEHLFVNNYDGLKEYFMDKYSRKLDKGAVSIYPIGVKFPQHYEELNYNVFLKQELCNEIVEHFSTKYFRLKNYYEQILNNISKDS
jgi:hypothetical protein